MYYFSSTSSLIIISVVGRQFQNISLQLLQLKASCIVEKLGSPRSSTENRMDVAVGAEKFLNEDSGPAS